MSDTDEPTASLARIAGTFDNLGQALANVGTLKRLEREAQRMKAEDLKALTHERLKNAGMNRHERRRLLVQKVR